MSRSLKQVSVPATVWQELINQLPEMAYQLSGTGKVEKYINPLFNFYSNEEYGEYYLGVELRIFNGNKTSFSTKLLVEYSESGHIFVNDKNCLIKAQRFIAYIIGKKDQIQTTFNNLCTRFPWAFIYKLTNVLGKLPGVTPYCFERESDDFSWRIMEQDQMPIGNIFGFSSKHFAGFITQPQGYYYQDSIQYLVAEILRKATMELHPRIINTSEKLNLDDFTNFMNAFRGYIHQATLLNYYYKRKENEETFLKSDENHAQWMSQKDWSYMEKQFNHFWENKYDECLKLVIHHFQAMESIIGIKKVK